MPHGWDDDTETPARPIGDVLDGLGIEATLDNGDLPAAAIVLLKVIQPDGSSRLSMASSDGLDWIERVGMLRVAEQLESTTGFAATE